METKQYRETSYIVNAKGEVFRNNKQLKPYKNSKGYYKIDVYVEGTKTPTYLHRMIAEVFIPNTNNYPEVNHIDGDKSNNGVENLEWSTSANNMKHRSHVLRKNIGDNTHNVKIPDKEVLMLRWKKSVNYPMNIREIAEKWGVRVDYLRKVINGTQRVFLIDSSELGHTTMGKDNHTTQHSL